MDLDEVRKRRIQVFFERGIPIHVVTKSDSWINGFIKEISSDFCIVIDRKEGERLLFFNEIEKLEIFDGDYDSLPKVEG